MYLFDRLMQADPDAVAGGGAAEVSKPSMDDTIGALFDQMQGDGKVDEAGTLVDPEAGSAPADLAAGNAAPARGPDGKFASKVAAQDTETTNGAKDPVAGVVPAPKADTPTAVATSQFPEAPRSWNAQEKAEWAAMTEGHRAAAHRREENFHAGIEQYRGKASHFDALHAVISPHAEIFKETGQNAVENVGALLNLQQVLYRGDESQKLGTLLQIVEQSGIKPEVLIQGLQNPTARPAQDPRYDILAKRHDELARKLEQVQVAPLQSEIERFFGDPKNEFLKEPGIQESMLELSTSGVAKSVQEAYDKACRLSDSVQAKVSANKAEADRKVQAERDAAEAKRKADLVAKATKASSINVKPRGATAGPAAKGTMDDTIGKEYDRIMGSRN